MNKIRTLLEEIKKLDDLRREAEGDPPEDAMTLYPPAAPAAVKNSSTEVGAIPSRRRSATSWPLATASPNFAESSTS